MISKESKLGILFDLVELLSRDMAERTVLRGIIPLMDITTDGADPLLGCGRYRGGVSLNSSFNPLQLNADVSLCSGRGAMPQRESVMFEEVKIVAIIA